MFSKSEPKTSFNTLPELNKIALIIQEFRVKTAGMKKEAETNGMNSIEYLKHDAMEKLLCEFDNAITVFNKCFNSSNSREKNILEIVLLIIDLQLAFFNLDAKKLEIIFTPRNNKQLFVNNLVHYTTLGLGFTAGTLLTGPLFGLGMLIPSAIGSKVARNQIGINDPTPKSAMILVRLTKEMAEIMTGATKIVTSSLNLGSEGLPEFILIEKEKISEDLIKPMSFYILRDSSSLEILFKSSNKPAVQINITQYIKEQFFKEIQQVKTLSTIHQLLIIRAILKVKYATEYEEHNQETNRVKVN